MPTKIFVPLINPNEPDALLASWHVENGQKVVKGDLLCTLETTKSTVDLAAEDDGYLVGIQHQAGETVRAGDCLGYISPEQNWKPPALPDSAIIREPLQPDGLRITKPALKLAKQHGIALSSFPAGVLVTERMVKEKMEKIERKDELVLEPGENGNRLIIYGGGGHGKAVLDLIRANPAYQAAGFIDDKLPAGEMIMGLPVLGDATVLESLIQQGIRMAVNAVGGIGNVSVRVQVFRKLIDAGFSFPSLVHPTAFVEPSAVLAEGVQVFPHAYIGSEAKVGFGSIVNTGAIVSHDCKLGRVVNISPGAILAGAVLVGNRVLIGMGVTVNLAVSVGDGARIGNSATVKADIPAGGIVRAGTIWPVG